MAQSKHVHWKVLTNPDYLGAYSIPDGKEPIITIDYVARELVTGANGKKEECTVAHFKEEKVKPMILNHTNCKAIQKAYKTPYIDEWSGRKIQLYVDHNVRFGGDTVDGLRIRPFVPKKAVPPQKEYVCADCGCKIEDSAEKTASEIAQNTQDSYGKILCEKCAASAAVNKTKPSEEALSLSAELQEE